MDRDRVMNGRICYEEFLSQVRNPSRHKCHRLGLGSSPVHEHYRIPVFI